MNTTHFVIMNQMNTTNMINQMNMIHMMNNHHNTTETMCNLTGVDLVIIITTREIVMFSMSNSGRINLR